MNGDRRFSRPLLAYVLFCVLLYAGCSSGGGGGSHQEEAVPVIHLPDLFSTVETIDVNVAYEPGAEPFAGTLTAFPGFKYWSLLEENLEALFASRTNVPEVSVPRELADMIRMSDRNRDSWTVGQVVSLANDLWDMTETSRAAEYYVLFLNGYYDDGEKVQENVIGISLGDTPVIAIFKEVITSSKYSFFNSAIMEQGTLVHEFGHCLGLVEFGIPMAIDHQDPEHPYHCINSRCAMNWQFEGGDMSAFSMMFVETGTVIMFCDECLEDTTAYTP